jgi:hypothetical protein
MYKNGFNMLYWGFLFTMLDFKLQGFDILPDIVGYILISVGLKILLEQSGYFKKAAIFNIPMIVLSIFSIYEPPAKGGSGINFGPFGLIGIPLMIAGIVFSLLVIYNIFKGIEEMALIRNQMDIADESRQRWGQYFAFSIATLFAFILILIPPLAIIYVIVMFIIAIALTSIILIFMKKCEERLY